MLNRVVISPKRGKFPPQLVTLQSDGGLAGKKVFFLKKAIRVTLSEVSKIFLGRPTARKRFRAVGFAQFRLGLSRLRTSVESVFPRLENSSAEEQ